MYRWTGLIYDTASNHPVGRFPGWGRSGATFGGGTVLYAAALTNAFANTGSEVLIYKPTPAVSLLAQLVPCGGGAESETSAAFECAPGP